MQGCSAKGLQYYQGDARISSWLAKGAACASASAVSAQVMLICSVAAEIAERLQQAACMTCLGYLPGHLSRGQICVSSVHSFTLQRL